MDKMYLCIDLKCFYASCECVKRGLDPFTTNLVVADPSRGNGAICLAITPAMKALGIKNRCRIFEIPKDVEYIVALPKMKDYIKISSEIYAIYLKYISPEDILVYSIDECFFDITGYLNLYNIDAKTLAKRMIDDVYHTTGICATVGIGTNLFLTKVALDVTAKKAIDFMGYLDEEEFKKTVWYHQPITDIWNIGRGTANRLAKKFNAYNLHDITLIPEEKLYKEFGVNAEFLIDHAHGIEPCTIKEIHEYHSKGNSMSNTQVLFEDYAYKDALLVMKEMVEVNVLNLVDQDLVTNHIGVYIGYSKDIIPPSCSNLKLDEYTNSYKKLSEYIMTLFEKICNQNYPIRRLGLSFGNVVNSEFKTYNLFTNEKEEEDELKMQKAILSIKHRYGKNSIVKGMDLQPKATTITRNTLIGGHNGE